MNLLYTCALVVGLVYHVACQARRKLNITPPIRLKPGETPVQEPGWKHCVTDLKVNGAVRKLRSPDYPKLPTNQMQCSWILEAPIGWKVIISFSDLELTPPGGPGSTKSCQTSYVKIIDMTSKASQGKFCGTQAPGDYVSLGSFLRIDLQGDRSKTPRRGFIINYTITKAASGFRAAKKSSSPSDSKSGKVNFNDFMSKRQKDISSQENSLKFRRPPVPKRLIYGSQTTTPKLTTTTVANEGWYGDQPLPKGPVKQSTPKGTKVQIKRPSSNGARIVMNQRQSKITNSQDVSNPPQDHRSVNAKENIDSDYNAKENIDSDEIRQAPRLYGVNNQPHIQVWDENDKNSKSTGKDTKLVVHQNSPSLSTTQIVVIVVGVIICFILVFTAYLIKRFCFDMKDTKKDEKKKSSHSENEIIEDPYNITKNIPLPGVSRPGSACSASSEIPNKSRTSFGLFDVTSPNNNLGVSRKSRHQSLVEEQERIYRNHIALLKNQKHNSELNRCPSYRRSNVNRPLPPVPKNMTRGSKRSKNCDVDEDYWSGSDEDPDIVSMKREFSEWEIREQKNSKKKQRYL